MLLWQEAQLLHKLKIPIDCLKAWDTGGHFDKLEHCIMTNYAAQAKDGLSPFFYILHDSER